MRLGPLLLTLPSLAIAACATAQTFTTSASMPLHYTTSAPPAAPYLRAYATYNLDAKRISAFLKTVPAQQFPGDRSLARDIEIPMPDNTTQKFRIVEAPIMTPELQKQTPVRTYAGYGVDDRSATIRLDLGPNGFHGYVYSGEGDVVIEPLDRGDQNHLLVYYKRDNLQPRLFTCETVGSDDFAPMVNKGSFNIHPVSSTLYTYRLAMNADFEYYQFWGSNLTNATNGLITSVNRVVGVYEKDFSISMTLVYRKIWTTSADPYTNNNGSTMLGQNQTETDASVGSANYDIGHVFSTGGGGVAGLKVVGVGGQKAKGVTGSGTPTGDGFDIDYVAHEMGHQYGGNHTFNSVSSNCGGGNRTASAAYEPGSGTTIMAYAGICAPEDVQPHSDAYFHVKSFDEIIAWRNNGGSNAVQSGLANSAPTVNAGPDFTIPLSTPYRLTAVGSDPDNDPLTYCWEEYDLGSSTPPYNPANGPMNRSKNPTTSPTRFIPALPVVLGTASEAWEHLPTVARTINFRVTARDNKSGGGAFANDLMSISATGSPFLVTAPVAAVSWQGNTQQTVTWTATGTATAVRILLSTDGGNSYGAGTATVLVANTPNDGTETVTIPNTPTGNARIIVEAVNNIYYNVSPTFTITAGATEQTVAPTNLTLFRGIQFSGSIGSFANSDDDRYQVRPGPVATGTEAPIQMILEATSPSSSATTLKFKVESSASSPNVGQTIYLFDWTANAYVSMSSVSLPVADGVIEVTATNPNRFIQPGTNLLRARISGNQVGPVVTYPYTMRVDQAIWTIGN